MLIRVIPSTALSSNNKISKSPLIITVTMNKDLTVRGRNTILWECRTHNLQTYIVSELANSSELDIGLRDTSHV